MPEPAHQQVSSNNLDLSAPEEAYSRNVRASGTLKFGYEGVFKILYSAIHCSVPLQFFGNEGVHSGHWEKMKHRKKSFKREIIQVKYTALCFKDSEILDLVNISMQK